jgi:hypothetical protein
MVTKYVSIFLGLYNSLSFITDVVKIQPYLEIINLITFIHQRAEAIPVHAMEALGGGEV